MIRSRWIFAAVLLPAFLFLGGAAFPQTDVAASVYGAFSGTTTSTGIHQSPSNAAGALIELRHIANPILGFEATYAWNRANQTYTYTGPTPTHLTPCPSCGEPYSVSVPSDAHEITADWVPSLSIASLRPFGVLGVGVLLNVPSGGASVSGTASTSSAAGDTKTSTQAVYVYGAGLDWGILPHIGLRFQYRGNLYKAPDVTTLFSSTGKFTHTAEPVAGIYLRL